MTGLKIIEKVADINVMTERWVGFIFKNYHIAAISMSKCWTRDNETQQLSE